MASELNSDIRDGRQHLAAIREHEDEFERITEKIAKIKPSPDAPGLLESLGTALAYLNQIATCDWGCQETSAEHVRRHLIARATSNIRAGLRLLSASYVPEALACYRSSWEVVNLLHLFRASDGSFKQFLSSSENARDKKFGTARVRRRLEELGTVSLIDDKIYKLLSRRYVHPTTTSAPLFLRVKGGSHLNFHEIQTTILALLAHFNLMAVGLFTFGMDLLEITGKEDGLGQIGLQLQGSARTYLSMTQAMLEDEG